VDEEEKVAIKQLSPLDAAWLALESRDTPMHVGGLFEFSPPEGAEDIWLFEQFERMRAAKTIPAPWNLKLLEGPLIGPRLPLLVEDRNIDIDYHVRLSALPRPGGQRELGVLVSRLHSYQLDLHRPLWEAHVIEGLDNGRFALYVKMHHSLIDGVSGIRMLLRTLTADPDRRDVPPFWTVAAGQRRKPAPEQDRGGGGLPVVGRALGAAREGGEAALGLARAGVELGRARLEQGGLQTPYTAPNSVLSSKIAGQRRFATQQYELELLRSLARHADCTLNDIILYLCSSALRRYLLEHAKLPSQPLTAGIPVNLRAADDESAGNAIGFIVAELATNVADPGERLTAIHRSTEEAKKHLGQLPQAARTPYTLLLNGPYIGGLVLGLANFSPVPFSIAISNVPGPPEPLYYNGARLDAIFPLSLLTHGNALNITCLSYAGTLGFGFTGARDTLPHLQRLAVYTGEAVEETADWLLGRKLTADHAADKKAPNRAGVRGEDAGDSGARKKGKKSGSNGGGSGKRASSRTKAGSEPEKAERKTARKTAAKKTATES
jgi:diacylglycerol O-acyltransferase / wax synthase